MAKAQPFTTSTSTRTSPIEIGAAYLDTRELGLHHLTVLDTMLDSYCPSVPWTSEKQAALWQALVVLSRILTSGILEHMITSDLAEHLGEKLRQGRSSLSPLEGAYRHASSRSQTIAETSLICQRLSCVHRIPRRSACLLVGRHMGKEYPQRIAAHRKGENEEKVDRDG